MKVIIAGGGTGGHLYPGIALARAILRTGGNEVLFVGTREGIEARVLPKEGLPVRFISAGKIKGMGAGAALKSSMLMPFGLLQSFLLLKEERPDIVVGVGGYASAPISAAAWLKRIPLIIIEPNSYPGLANRMLGRIADMILLPFPGSDTRGCFQSAKTVTTGPLVREGIEHGDRMKPIREYGLDPAGFTVLVFGGSGGAHAINAVMIKAAALIKKVSGIQVIHQTGDKDAEEVKKAYMEAGLRAVVLPYIYDMASAYAAADLVVSRSGATTIAELAVCGKPAVLIPYPFAADNHQEYNARTLASYGAATVIPQSELTPERLVKEMEAYRARRGETRPIMSSDADRKIVRLIADYVQAD